MKHTIALAITLTIAHLMGFHNELIITIAFLIISNVIEMNSIRNQNILAEIAKQEEELKREAQYRKNYNKFIAQCIKDAKEDRYARILLNY